MNLDDPNPNNLPGPLRVCALALSQIKGFKEHLPLVSVLCNKGLRPRHWQNLNKAAGFDITPNAGTRLLISSYLLSLLLYSILFIAILL